MSDIELTGRCSQQELTAEKSRALLKGVPQKAPTTQMKIADEPLIPGGSSATRRATGKPCLKRE